jgi:release factor glutamine methyltransferase
MRNTIKYIVGMVYKPLLVKYLSKTRRYNYKGISLVVPPQVFHPGFFSSTKLLLNYVASQPLKQYSLLELGAGSGLISMYAARYGAQVTASDINSVAIRYLHQNTSLNKLSIHIVHSDLFDDIPVQTFDYIIINPPYYKKQPKTESDYAWYCGSNGEYFKQLFHHLSIYTHSLTKVFITLCSGCDIQMIREMALENQVTLTCVQKTRNLVEENFIFRIEPLK